MLGSRLGALELLSSTLAQAGDLDEGISQLREVVRQDPEDPRAHLNLAAALAEAGEYDAAIRENERVLELSPNEKTRARTLFYLGTFYERKKLL